MREQIELTINGEPRKLAAGLTVAGMLEALEIVGGKGAVEQNREIVPGSLHGETAVCDGDQIEIVHFIGGG